MAVAEITWDDATLVVHTKTEESIRRGVLYDMIPNLVAIDEGGRRKESRKRFADFATAADDSDIFWGV